MLESYGTSLSLLFIVLIETIIVCWVYGTERFCQNIEQMSGSRPGLYWRVCWKYISPSILVIIFLSACSQELGKYRRLEQGNYVYPAWAPALGLVMTSSSVACIPIYALYHWHCKSGPGNWRQVSCRSNRCFYFRALKLTVTLNTTTTAEYSDSRKPSSPFRISEPAVAWPVAATPTPKPFRFEARP